MNSLFRLWCSALCAQASLLCLTGGLVLSGCGREAGRVGRDDAATGQSQAPLPASARVFPTRGVVREIAEGGKSMVVRHEEIPGFMPAMVMELTARAPSELKGLSPGDTVTFELVALEDGHWIQSVKRVDAVPVEPVKPLSPLVIAQPLAAVEPGGVFPEVVIRDEEGRNVSLSSMRGSAVAVTFFLRGARCRIFARGC